MAKSTNRVIRGLEFSGPPTPPLGKGRGWRVNQGQCPGTCLLCLRNEASIKTQKHWVRRAAGLGTPNIPTCHRAGPTCPRERCLFAVGLTLHISPSGC